MYKLYNVKTWGSLAPHCVIEELEVPYQNIWMTREQVKAPEYREIHPLGFVPALGLDDGRIIIESAAIVTFLTSAHTEKALCPPVGSDDYAEFLSWLNYMSTSLYPIVSLGFPGSGLALTDEQDAHIVETATRIADERFIYVESQLEKEGPWLMGETYSALDPYLFMLTLWARPTEAAFHKRHPTLARHAAAIRQRPRLKAVLEAHGVMQPGGYGS